MFRNQLTSLIFTAGVAAAISLPGIGIAYERDDALLVQKSVGTAADGAFGPGSRRAAESWLTAHPDAGLPSISADNIEEALPLWASYFRRQNAAEIDLAGNCSNPISFDPMGAESPFYGNHRGTWGTDVPHQLIVTKITPAGAKGFYAVGAPFDACYAFAGAKIAEDTMTVEWMRFGIKVTYRLDGDGVLAGTYSEGDAPPANGIFYSDTEAPAPTQ